MNLYRMCETTENHDLVEIQINPLHTNHVHCILKVVCIAIKKHPQTLIKRICECFILYGKVWSQYSFIPETAGQVSLSPLSTVSSLPTETAFFLPSRSVVLR